MTEEQREMELREIILCNIDEYEPDIPLNLTIEEAVVKHEDIFRTHYRFTDKDFDYMVLDILNYIKNK